MSRTKLANQLIYARRNARAKAQGWQGYGQKRYWAENGLAHQYARALCPEGPGESRPRSLLCQEHNDIVNPRRPQQGARVGTWQERLRAAAKAAE